MAHIGKKIRMNRIFNSITNKSVVVPMDDGLIDGAEQGLLNASKKVNEIVSAEANAILGFKGLFKNSFPHKSNIGTMMNITASTSLSSHTNKVLVSSVEDAVAYGMDGVAVHINVSSKYERNMLEIAGMISRECEILGMPLMILAYPRSEDDASNDNNYLHYKTDNPEKYAKLVRHASRIAVEIGADIVKTHYTGSIETFKTVIQACGNIPVLIAGGPKISIQEIFSNAYGAIQAGGAGVCFGRNSFNDENTTCFVKTLNKVVHENFTDKDAIEFYKTNTFS